MMTFNSKTLTIKKLFKMAMKYENLYLKSSAIKLNIALTILSLLYLFQIIN